MMNNDLISRQAIKEKLQEHYDFFVNTYDGFENMPSNIKLRVDEITNCIAEVVNMPAVQPVQKTGRETGRWIDDNCSECGQYVYHGDARNYCPNCGAKMESDNDDN